MKLDPLSSGQLNRIGKGKLLYWNLLLAKRWDTLTSVLSVEINSLAGDLGFFCPELCQKQNHISCNSEKGAVAS